MGVDIQMGHHLWMTWLQIAAEREQAAQQARSRGIDLGVEGGTAFGDALLEEMRASMVAISGAAHAIDALFGEIAPLVPVPTTLATTWKANRTARPIRIYETLKMGCKLGPKAAQWPSQFKALYNLRDPVVHHEIRHQPTAPHPNGLVHVAQETADYCVENVRASLDLAIDVAVTTIRQPKAPNLTAWATRMAHVADTVETYRSSS